jgi:hypothetical protein
MEVVSLVAVTLQRTRSWDKNLFQETGLGMARSVSRPVSHMSLYRRSHVYLPSHRVFAGPDGCEYKWMLNSTASEVRRRVYNALLLLNLSSAETEQWTQACRGAVSPWTKQSVLPAAKSLPRDFSSWRAYS